LNSAHSELNWTAAGRPVDGLWTGHTLSIARQNAAMDGWTGPGDQVYPMAPTFMMLSSHDSVT